MAKKKTFSKPKPRKFQKFDKVDIADIDYKKPAILKKFLSPRFKILPKKVTNLSTSKQNKLRDEIKKARLMGLLPFTDSHALR